MVPNSLPMVHTAGENRRSSFSTSSGRRRRGEVQIVTQLPEHRIADAAADQVQLVPVLDEQRPQPVDDRGSLELRHEGQSSWPFDRLMTHLLAAYAEARIWREAAPVAPDLRRRDERS